MAEDKNFHNQLLDKVRAYRMPKAAQELLSTHLPLTISGITASGKNSTTQYIMGSTDYRHVVTHTTRPLREGEESGKDYHFVSEEEMIRLLETESMVEVQLVHGTQVSGVSIKAYQDVIASGHKPLLNIDVQGVEKIGLYVPSLRPVFLLPPDFESWVQMLEKRGRMSHSERLRRMHSAREELEKIMNSVHFFLVINRDVPQTAREILGNVHDLSSQRQGRETARLLLERLKTI